MHRVGLIVPYDFQLLSLAPLAAFELAKLPSEGRLMRLSYYRNMVVRFDLPLVWPL
jgi:hypothetical protein